MGYTGEADTSPKQVMRNEYVKYRKQTSLGQQVDLLDLADGILLQWYSGFDAALCENTYSPSSKACTCDNIPAADYPNVLDSTKDAGGLLVSAWQTKMVGQGPDNQFQMPQGHRLPRLAIQRRASLLTPALP